VQSSAEKRYSKTMADLLLKYQEVILVCVLGFALYVIIFG